MLLQRTRGLGFEALRRRRRGGPGGVAGNPPALLVTFGGKSNAPVPPCRRLLPPQGFFSFVLSPKKKTNAHKIIFPFGLTYPMPYVIILLLPTEKLSAKRSGCNPPFLQEVLRTPQDKPAYASADSLYSIPYPSPIFKGRAGRGICTGAVLCIPICLIRNARNNSVGSVCAPHGAFLY